MKLLICDQCGDVFNLSFTLKQCSCGHVKGHYIDNVNAVVNGNGFSLAIGNGALYIAITKSMQDLSGNREDFIETGKITHCWVRPHTGPGNPHTTVNPDL